MYEDVIGVAAVECGYTGGETSDPDYRSVCKGDTGHAEAVRLTYDPDVISYDELLDIFFHVHDPTQLNRQGNDIGTQYRSAIFPHDERQRAAAEAAIGRAQAAHSQPVVTAIEPLGNWHQAEIEHQDYWARKGSRNPYCLAVIPPKLRKLRKDFAARLKTEQA
ncbi:MAG: peptide-methionine (S)-S-oxide reductase MsrA [Sphingomonadaceae bacterium]